MTSTAGVSPEAECTSLQHCSSVPVHAAPVSQSAAVILHSVQQSDGHGPPKHKTHSTAQCYSPPTPAAVQPVYR